MPLSEHSVSRNERRDQNPAEKDAFRQRISVWRVQPSCSQPETRTLRLSRLIPLWPHEIEDRSPQAGIRIIKALERALRTERRRGKSGHWCYDLNRHLALSRALREERQRFCRIYRQSVPRSTRTEGVAEHRRGA